MRRRALIMGCGEWCDDKIDKEAQSKHANIRLWDLKWMGGKGDEGWWLRMEGWVGNGNWFGFEIGRRSNSMSVSVQGMGMQTSPPGCLVWSQGGPSKAGLWEEIAGICGILKRRKKTRSSDPNVPPSIAFSLSSRLLMASRETIGREGFGKWNYVELRFEIEF